MTNLVLFKIVLLLSPLAQAALNTPTNRYLLENTVPGQRLLARLSDPQFGYCEKLLSKQQASAMDRMEGTLVSSPDLAEVSNDLLDRLEIIQDQMKGVHSDMRQALNALAYDYLTINPAPGKFKNFLRRVWGGKPDIQFQDPAESDLVFKDKPSVKTLAGQAQSRYQNFQAAFTQLIHWKNGRSSGIAMSEALESFYRTFVGLRELSDALQWERALGSTADLSQEDQIRKAIASHLLEQMPRLKLKTTWMGSGPALNAHAAKIRDILRQ